MKADPQFTGLPPEFWANIRTIGEAVGYTVRGQHVVHAPTDEEIKQAYYRLGLGTQHIFRGNRPTVFGSNFELTFGTVPTVSTIMSSLD